MKNNSKRKSKAIIHAVLGIIILLALFLIVGRVGYHETHYNRKGIIISIDSNSIVTVKDNCNYLWSFTEDGYSEGNEVVMLMSTQGTESIIEDDVIINVKLY